MKTITPKKPKPCPNCNNTNTTTLGTGQGQTLIHCHNCKQKNTIKVNQK